MIVNAVAVADWLTDRAFSVWDTVVYPNPKPGPAPAAPKTRSQMSTWTPADLEAADRTTYDEWRRTAIPDPRIPQPDLDWLNYVPWIAGGALVLTAFMAYQAAKQTPYYRAYRSFR